MSTPNQFFSLPRFARLHRWHFAQHRRLYLLMFLGIGLLSSITWVVFVLTANNHQRFEDDSQAFYMVMHLMVVPCLFSAWFYHFTFKKEGQISFFSLPASHFEKFLLAVLYCGLFVLIANVALYAFSESLARAVHTAVADQQYEMDYYYHQEYYDKHPFHGRTIFSWPEVKGSLVLLLYLLYASLSGLMVFGALFYRRFHFFKSVVTGGLLILGTVAWVITCNGMYDIDGWQYSAFEHRFFDSQVDFFDEWYHHPFYLTLMTCGIVLALVFWITNYFLIKERELK